MKMSVLKSGGCGARILEDEARERVGRAIAQLSLDERIGDLLLEAAFTDLISAHKGFEFERMYEEQAERAGFAIAIRQVREKMGIEHRIFIVRGPAVNRKISGVARVRRVASPESAVSDRVSVS